MAERDGAAMRVDEIGIVLDAELAQAGDALLAKASLSSIRSKSLIFSPAAPSACAVAGTGPMPMMRGGTAAEARPRIRAAASAVLLHRGFRGQNHRRPRRH
jgi:hypothetical protein